jgi:diacylglycerol kinase (ATP)
VLIAGGDGTVNWVLETIESLRPLRNPQIALLSLGTGNDLSRGMFIGIGLINACFVALGWGDGHSGAIDANELFARIDAAKPVQLDRWSIRIHNRRYLGLYPTDRTLTMSNYMSIGVDACVTLNMHRSRQSMPRALSSRLLTKLLFFTYGTKDVLEHVCKDLNNKVELIIDERRVELPALEGIVVLNIPCWGAGVRVCVSACFLVTVAICLDMGNG